MTINLYRVLNAFKTMYEAYSPNDYNIPSEHIASAIKNGIPPDIANRYGSTYRYDFDAMARDIKRDAEYRAKSDAAERQRSEMIAKLDQLEKGSQPLSMTELVHVVANDDDLYSALAAFQGGEPDIFDVDHDVANKLDMLMRRMKPTDLGYPLYRGETKYGDDIRHPRGFHSWTPAKDIASDFNDSRSSYIMKWEGPVQGFSFNDIVDARMRLRPGTNHYAGPQTQWLIIDPPKDKIQIGESTSYTMWNEKHIVWEQGEYKIAVNTPDDPSYYTVWTEDNKRIGYLSLSPVRKKGSKWMSIDSVEVDKGHRGNGLGIALYRVALNTMGPEYLGLYSYLPNVANKRQVPVIHRRLGGTVVDGDYMFIPRDDNARNTINGLNEAVDYDSLNVMINDAVELVIEYIDWSSGSLDHVVGMYAGGLYDPDTEEYDELIDVDAYELFTNDENFNRYVKDMFRRDARNFISNLMDIFDGKRIRVFRAIDAPDGWTPEAQPLGIYWSWDESAAQTHWGKGHIYEYTITGIIDANHVEWTTTIALNIEPNIGDDEREIRVMEGAPIMIEQIIKSRGGKVIDGETYNYLKGKVLNA